MTDNARTFLPCIGGTSHRPRSRLALARILAGLTQAELAQALGLSPAWVSGVENGHIIPTLQQKIAVARELCLELDLLFVEDDN